MALFLRQAVSRGPRRSPDPRRLHPRTRACPPLGALTGALRTEARAVSARSNDAHANGARESVPLIISTFKGEKLDASGDFKVRALATGWRGPFLKAGNKRAAHISLLSESLSRSSRRCQRHNRARGQRTQKILRLLLRTTNVAAFGKLPARPAAFEHCGTGPGLPGRGGRGGSTALRLVATLALKIIFPAEKSWKKLKKAEKRVSSGNRRISHRDGRLRVGVASRSAIIMIIMMMARAS
jgi:hypothetical protein